MKYLLIVLLPLLSICDQACAQKDSSTTSVIVPIALSISGTVLHIEDQLKRDIQTEISDHLSTPSLTIDDYLQYIPSIQQLIYHLDSRSVDRRYHLRQYTLSTMGAIGVTYAMKSVISATRPRGGGRSFPSGHTTFAFSTAECMYQIYREDRPLLAYLSYLPAVSVGVFRVTRGEHWVSDVLMGAGLGMLITRLTYILLPDEKQTDRTDTTLQNLHIGMSGDGFSLRYSF